MSFGQTLNETLMRQTKGSFHYFTSSESSYPVTHDIRPYRELTKLEVLPVGKISSEVEEKLKDFAAAYGRPMRQQQIDSIRQWQLLGHYLIYCYKRAVIPSSEINLYAGPSNNSNNPPRSTENEDSATSSAETREQEVSNHAGEETEVVQFEPDSPAESESDSDGDNVGIDASSLFLVGHSSRAGRRVKLKRKYLF